MSAVAKADVRDARQRAGQIRDRLATAAVRNLGAATESAREREDWRTLGYSSWDEYAVRLLEMPWLADRVTSTSVYFIQAVGGGPIKIGYAANVATRLNALANSSPVVLRVIAVIDGGGRAEEAELHRRFAAARLHGEWFRPVPELLAYVAENAEPAR